MARDADGCEKEPLRERVSVWLIGRRAALAVRGRRLLRPGTFSVGLVGAVYTATQLLRANEVPSKGAYDRWEPLWFVLIGSGLLTLVGGFLIVYGYSRLLKKNVKDDELSEVCKAVWLIVVRELGVPMEKVGVHVWGVRGHVWGLQHLDRRGRFVIERRRQTPVTWRKNKGGIGVAWAKCEPVVANVEALEALAPDRAAFCALERDVRFGLNWKEFRASRHYRAILAIPLWVGPEAALRVGGCLSVDLQVDGRANDLDNLFQANNFSAVLSVCEAVLGRTT